MVIFPSPEWVASWVELANSDEAFRSASAGWDGVICVVIEADGAADIKDDLYLRLAGRDGHWHENTLAADAGLLDGSVFTIRGPYSTWKSVICQQLHPITGIVQGRLRLHGQLSSFTRWSRATLIMTQLAGRIDTAFVDEQR
jgi:putative sterol carrier protein